MQAMAQTRKHWLRMTIVLCAVAVVLACVIVATRHRPPRWRGFPGVPTMSFAEMLQGSNFTATVESTLVGNRQPGRSAETGEPKASTNGAAYLMVYLTLADRRRLCIYEENAQPSHVTFVAHLEQGRRYSFPESYVNWLKASSIDK